MYKPKRKNNTDDKCKQINLHQYKEPSKQNFFKCCVNVINERNRVHYLLKKNQFISGRIWKVAAISAICAAPSVTGLSPVVDLGLLTKEIALYKSQLSLPEKTSAEFQRMGPEMQGKIAKVLISSGSEITKQLASYAGGNKVVEGNWFAKILGTITGSIAFFSTYYFQNNHLNEMEETALNILDSMARSRDATCF